MKRIKYFIFFALLSLIISGCASYVDVDQTTARKCSICNGTGFVTELDTRFLPNVVYINVICKWCGGHGIAMEPYYYIETGIIYNRHYPHRVIRNPRHPRIKTPNPRIDHRMNPAQKRQSPQHPKGNRK